MSGNYNNSENYIGMYSNNYQPSNLGPIPEATTYWETRNTWTPMEPLETPMETYGNTHSVPENVCLIDWDTMKETGEIPSWFSVYPNPTYPHGGEFLSNYSYTRVQSEPMVIDGVNRAPFLCTAGETQAQRETFFIDTQISNRTNVRSNKIDPETGEVIPPKKNQPQLNTKNVQQTANRKKESKNEVRKLQRPSSQSNRRSVNYQRHTGRGKLCVFCKKNGEMPRVYQNHVLKLDDNTIVCPVLRAYTCDICGATGDNAHTRKHCPIFMEVKDTKPKIKRMSNGLLTTRVEHK